MNKSFWPTTSAVIIFFLSIGLFYQCQRKKSNELLKETLTSNEKAAVIINPKSGNVTVLKKEINGKGQTEIKKEVTTGAREIRVSIDNNGGVSVQAKTIGFSHNLGVTLGIGDQPRVGLDLEWFYWKQFGVISGVSSDRESHVSLYTGADYKIPWTLTRNTFLFLSYDSRKTICGGIRVEL